MDTTERSMTDEERSISGMETLKTLRGERREEALSMSEMETLKTAHPEGEMASEAMSMGERETLREEDGWGILEEWDGKRWQAGETILGRYVVEKELGQGGMGVVYACQDKVGGVRVAVKALPPELSHNSVEMEEVRANFELVYGLSHPNIAGVRTLEKDSRGEYFLVMEVAEGESLRRWMRREGAANGGRIPLLKTLGVLRQVASALDYAHGEKVVHRDVKPGNVMIDKRGKVKVLDFGLAAQIRTSLSRASQAYRGTSGTGPYMAPEQWRGQPQDGSADQYALGVMAYEMLAGRLPFENSELAVLREVVLKEDLPEIPGIPKVTMDALRRAMAKQEELRWGTCSAFVEALGGGRPRGGRRARKRRKWPWKAVLTAVLLAAVGGGTWMWVDWAQTQARAAAAAKQAAAAAQEAAEEARTAAAAAKERAVAVPGAIDQRAYEEAAGAQSAGAEAFEAEEYDRARASWAEAARKYDASAETAARDGATAFQQSAAAARNRAEGVGGAEGLESFAAGKKAESEGLAAFRNGEYDRAKASWAAAAGKYGEAAATAAQALREESKKQARQHALSILKKAAESRKEALKMGAGELEAYVAAEGAREEGVTSFHAEDYDGARTAWTRALGKYTEALGLAQTRRERAEKLKALLGEARAAAENEWWEEVRRKAEAVLAEAPENREARRWLNTAEQALQPTAAPEAEDTGRKAGTVEWVWLPGGTELEVVWCPPGAPGAGGKTLPGFWMGRTEVTQGQWKSLMESRVLNDRTRGVEFPPDPDWPMRAVSWTECVEFCEQMNEKVTSKLSGVWRLPTEAEWKWANEAGGGSAGTAWFRDTSGGHPHRVKESTPNAWGLFDMRGNVEEWCLDFYGDDHLSREMRVKRGGAYNSENGDRWWGMEGTDEPTVGFRVCLIED